MKMRFCLLSLLIAASSLGLKAQNPTVAAPNPYSDSMANISSELTRISKSVQTLNDRFKVFFDRFGAVGGTTISERQQRIVTGLQSLAIAEQCVANFQLLQIDLVNKQNDARAKLSQVEIDLRPRNIDRSVAFEGTTETEELRESKRQKLQAERVSLSQLLSQIQSTLADTSDRLREAQITANRLRQVYLPLIDRELSEQ